MIKINKSMIKINESMIEINHLMIQNQSFNVCRMSVINVCLGNDCVALKSF